QGAYEVVEYLLRAPNGAVLLANGDPEFLVCRYHSRGPSCRLPKAGVEVVQALAGLVDAHAGLLERERDLLERFGREPSRLTGFVDEIRGFRSGLPHHDERGGSESHATRGEDRQDGVEAREATNGGLDGVLQAGAAADEATKRELREA